MSFCNEDVFKYGLRLIEFIKYLIRQVEDLSDVLIELIYNLISYLKIISAIVKIKNLNSTIQKLE